MHRTPRATAHAKAGHITHDAHTSTQPRSARTPLPCTARTKWRLARGAQRKRCARQPAGGPHSNTTGAVGALGIDDVHGLTVNPGCCHTQRIFGVNKGMMIELNRLRIRYCPIRLGRGERFYNSSCTSVSRVIVSRITHGVPGFRSIVRRVNVATRRIDRLRILIKPMPTLDVICCISAIDQCFCIHIWGAHRQLCTRPPGDVSC